MARTGNKDSNTEVRGVKGLGSVRPSTAQVRADEPVEGVKRRGRPPGSKNKRPEANQVAATNTAIDPSIGAVIMAAGQNGPINTYTNRQHMDVRYIDQLALQGALDLDPDYQRQSGAWSPRRRRKLLYSILKGYDIPKLYFRMRMSEGGTVYEAVDGKQRITTVLDFISNRFPLGDEIPEVAGLKFNKLPMEFQQRILNYAMDIVILHNYSDAETSEMFLLLQQGVATNAQENRNAMGGYLRNRIAELSNHEVFKMVSFTNARFGHQQVAAQLMLLTLNGGKAATISKPKLDEMYREFNNPDQQTQETLDAAYETATQVLDLIHQGLSDDDLEVPAGSLAKGQFITLYVFVCDLMKRFGITDTPEEVIDAFFEFHRDYTEHRGNSRYPEFLKYDTFTGGGSDSADAIQGRVDIILNHARDWINTLPEQDNSELLNFQLKSAEKPGDVQKGNSGDDVNPANPEDDQE